MSMQVRKPAQLGMTRLEMHEAYDADRLGFLLDSVQQHGPVVEFSVGTVLVADPEAVHEVLKRTNTDFLISRNRRNEKTASHRGDAALDSWMSARRAVLSAVTGELLDNHLEWYEGQVTALLTEWSSRRTVHDPIPELTDLSSRAFVHLCLGHDDAKLRAGIAALLQSLLPIVQGNTELPGPLARLSPMRRHAARAERDLEFALTRKISEPDASGLVRALREAGVPARPLVRLLTSMAIASRLVPAAAITWVVAGMTTSAGSASSASSGDRVKTRSTALSPAAVENIIDESLRLWPPTWMLFRETDHEQVCGRWVLPAGAAVMISPYVSHRDPHEFPRPLEYNADRWYGVKPRPGSYIPFGGGSRWCLGAHLAKAQLRVTVACINRNVTMVTRTAPSTLDTRSTLIPDTFEFDVFSRGTASPARTGDQTMQVVPSRRLAETPGPDMGSNYAS